MTSSPYTLGVRRHHHLVEAVARGVHAGLPASVQLDDLIQDGAKGLMQAIRAADPTSGVPFAAHAAPFIRRRILDGLRRSQRQSRETPLTDAFPLEAGGDAPACPTAAMADERADNPVDRLMAREIRRAIGRQLTPRERRALHLFFVDGLTQRQTAAELGMSQGGFVKLIARVLRRLRASPRLRELAGLPALPTEPTDSRDARGAEGSTRAGRQGRHRTDAAKGAGGQARRAPAQDGEPPIVSSPPTLQPGPSPRKVSRERTVLCA